MFYFKGGTTVTESVKTLKDALVNAPDGAKSWCFRTMGEGGATDLHPQISCDGPADDEWPMVNSGRYFLQFYDSTGKPMGGAKLVQYQLPSVTPADQARPIPTAQPSLTETEMEADDAALGVSLDGLGRREHESRKYSEYQRATLDYYNKLMHALGVRGQQEVNDKTAQSDLIAAHCKTVLEEYVELHEKVAERLKQAIVLPPPPAPTPWDKIIGAAAPACAVIYTETIRAIKGAPSSEANRQNDKLLLQDNGAHAKIYDVIGKVGTAEKLSEVLGDKTQMAAWLKELMDVMGAAAGQEGPQVS